MHRSGLDRGDPSFVKELDLRVGIAFSRRIVTVTFLIPNRWVWGRLGDVLPSPELKGSIARVAPFFWSLWMLISYKKNRRQSDKSSSTPPKNNSLPLKMDGWETFILSFLGFGLFLGANWLSVVFCPENESQNPLSQRQFFEDDSFIFSFFAGGYTPSTRKVTDHVLPQAFWPSAW